MFSAATPWLVDLKWNADKQQQNNWKFVDKTKTSKNSQINFSVIFFK